MVYLSTTVEAIYRQEKLGLGVALLSFFPFFYSVNTITSRNIRDRYLNRQEEKTALRELRNLV